jgi:hypothetical protein
MIFSLFRQNPKIPSKISANAKRLPKWQNLAPVPSPVGKG